MAQSTTQQRVTRLAPSPTGALHLGNARTFVINWILARRRGWKVVLRVEDLDTPRTRAGAVEQAIDDLRWLGLDWDAGPVTQAADLSPYQAALDQLRRRGLIYPCTCTRSEIEAAQSAPHGDEHELRYPGTCRPSVAGPSAAGSGAPAATLVAQEIDIAWRVHVPDELITFDDRIHGRQAINVQQQVGDFVVASKNGLPAYQLAVVVDDARQGVTDVVRGDDLVRSTARQVLLYHLLSLGEPPAYWHLPLVIGADGRRLAKRHGDTRLAEYRGRGVAPERIMGLLACWSGVGERPRAMPLADFADAFDIAALPRDPAVFHPEHHQWLLA